MSISKYPSHAADIDWFFSLRTSGPPSVMSWNNASMHVIWPASFPSFYWEGVFLSLTRFLHARD